MDVLELLGELGGVPSASGFEAAAMRRAKELLLQYVDEAELDPLGNLIGVRRCGVADAPCVLLDAHLDQIGLVVTGEVDGFLRISPIGGVDVRMLPACEVLVLTDPPCPGIVTCMPPHLQTKEECEKAIEQKDLYLDVGGVPVPVGTPVVLQNEYVRLHNDVISGIALDDRAGFVALLRTMERLRNKKLGVDVVVLGSVQEEVGCRGAKVAGYRVNPDWAIAVDVTHGSTPDAPKGRTFDLGSGTAIGVGPNLHPEVSGRLTRLAEEKKIAHTIEVCEGETGTNAWVFQTVRQGIRTGLLSIPLRYMHTPVEVLCEKDIQATAKLLAEFVLSLGEETRRV